MKVVLASVVLALAVYQVALAAPPPGSTTRAVATTTAAAAVTTVLGETHLSAQAAAPAP